MRVNWGGPQGVLELQAVGFDQLAALAAYDLLPLRQAAALSVSIC